MGNSGIFSHICYFSINNYPKTYYYKGTNHRRHCICFYSDHIYSSSECFGCKYFPCLCRPDV